MIKIEIKNRFTGGVIFTYEKENATIKDAVLQALKESTNLLDANLRGADLRGANLYGADLYGADLRGADLRDCNLRGADLYGANLLDANLRGADLYGANLRGADLYGADLRDCNLRGADLRGAKLRDAKNKEEAYIPIFCKWSHSIKGDNIQIGCKVKSIEEWDSFFNSDETYSTKRNTEDFKQIQAVYLAYKAYLTHLKS